MEPMGLAMTWAGQVGQREGCAEQSKQEEVDDGIHPFQVKRPVQQSHHIFFYFDLAASLFACCVDLCE